MGFKEETVFAFNSVDKPENPQYLLLEKQKFNSLEKINKKQKGNIHYFINKQISLNSSLPNHQNSAIALSKIYANALPTSA
jgi:hypothetical protein